MLVKVSVENFKSFDKAAELTMISSNKIRTNANHRLKIKSTQLLKYAVVYGANASGKTNLALFFKFFKDSVCNGIPIEATQMFCKNRQENKERESSFEIQITVGDKFYAYGFSAVLSRRKVTGEWLYELYQNGSAKCLFEREGSKRPVLNDGITLTNTEKNKFETYADDFEGNEKEFNKMLEKTVVRYEERITNIMLECFSELENRGDNIYDALTDIDGLLNFDKLLGLP